MTQDIPEYGFDDDPINRDEYDPYDPDDNYLGETREEEKANIERARLEALENEGYEFRTTLTSLGVTGVYARRITLVLHGDGFWGSKREIHSYVTNEFYYKNLSKGLLWLHDNGVTEREMKLFLLYQRLAEEAYSFEEFRFDTTLFY